MTSAIRIMTMNKGGPVCATGRIHDELPAIKSAASSFARIMTTGIPAENLGAAAVNRASSVLAITRPGAPARSTGAFDVPLSCSELTKSVCASAHSTTSSSATSSCVLKAARTYGIEP